MGPKIDARTDVYSLGVALFEALTSRRPFEGATALAVLEAIRTEAPPSVRSLSPTLSRDADAVVRRAMQRSPGDRYATARELADDLAALAEGRPTRALAEQGGPMRSFFGRMRAASAGEPYEYRSPRTWLGLPLIHVNVGRRSRQERVRRARGWIAIAPIAVGGIALGNVTVGAIAIGNLSFGAIAFGGALAAGGAAMGGFSVGLLALGGLAAGGFAMGGLAVGYAAIGGLATGVFALGGHAKGTFIVSGDRRDAAAIEFFRRWTPWALRWMRLG